VFAPRGFGVNPNCWPPNGASVVLSEGNESMGSCRIPARQWEGDGLGLCVCVCVCVWVCVGQGHPLVSVGCVDVGVCAFVWRWWVGVVML
jgi:hypothetical protein